VNVGGQDERPRTALAAAVCVGLLTVGVGLTVAAGSSPLRLNLPVPTAVIPLLLLAAYAFTDRVMLEFEVRGNSHSVTLGQLPLALGVLLVDPGWHLVASLVATTGVIAVRRQPPLKALYNLAAAAFEVGAAAFIVSLAPSGVSPVLWLALLVGLLASDVVGPLSIGAVWRLLHMPVTVDEILAPMAVGVTTTLASTALTIIAVSAAQTEPASVLLIVLMAAAAAHAYHRHRRLRAQQRTTQDLYAFVRDLGPVDVDDSVALDVVEQVRLLLHAQRLELLAARRDGAWEALHAAEGEQPHRAPGAAPSGQAAHRSTSGRLAAQSDPVSCMSTPLFGSSGLLGLLTARGRLGDVRDFDLGDVRLLETVGREVATALERGRLLADLRRTATTDSLTGLPNLPELARRLDQALRDADGLMVAAFTVESFRDVNDTLGHEVADALLVETTRRLVRCHPGALVGRIGGGRFAIAVPSGGGELSPQLFGLSLRAQVEGEARIGAVGTHIKLSVGVARFPEDGGDATTLLRRAQTAMTSARAAYGGPVAWAPAYEVEGQRRLAVVTALREAVVTGAIGLAFQPKLGARSGAVSGVEALARWTHPALGTVQPEEFIPLAETSGFIGPLTSTVLRQATTACRGWQGRAAGVGVAVNVSAGTVLDPSFVTEVADLLTTSGLAPQLLTLELTEGVVVSDPDLAVERLGELRALGVRIAVDDFGTGYSSLTYLKSLPVDEVKIDKTFVAGCGVDPADHAVVRSVVDIAHTRGLRVVAEGVEALRQQDALIELGVDEVQGYLHARPMPAQAMAAWLRSRSAHARG
jgi:diguanylate cyclase (GGDEF)-like protein